MRFLLPLLAVLALHGQTAHQQLARDIFQELIEINTTDTAGDNTRAAEAMAARFRRAGYPAGDVQVLAPAPKKGNVIVRLRGTGAARPILFIGHLDVVEALRADWSFDPFVFRRAGRLLLRTGHPGHQGQRRHYGGRVPSHEAGEFPAGARPDPGADRRRRDRARQRRGLAGAEPPRPHRRGVLHQYRRRRRAVEERQAPAR